MTRAVLLAVAEGTARLEGQEAVRRLLAAVAERLPDADVRIAYDDVQEPDLATALAALPPSSPVVVVPLTAGHPPAAALAAAATAHPDAHVVEALAPDARLARLLAARLREQHADVFGPDASDAVVLAMPGSDAERGRAQAAMLAEELGREVHLSRFPMSEPRSAQLVAEARNRGPGGGQARRVVIVSTVFAAGHLHDAATRGGGDVVTAPLLGAGAPAPELVELLADRFLDALDGPVSSAL